MVVGKGAGRNQGASHPGQGLEEFLWPADTRKGDHRLTRQVVVVDQRHEPCRDHRLSPAKTVFDSHPVRADNRDCVNPVHGSRQGLAQRPGGHHAPVAETVTAIDHQYGYILVQGGVLKPVIHDDRRGARGNCGLGTGDAVA